MKIALDARWIFPETSGIGRHTQLLIQGLQSLGSAHEFVLIFEEESMESKVCREVNWTGETLRVPYGLFTIPNQLQLLRTLKKQGVDCYHSTNYMMPLPGAPRHRPGNIKTVITIHDLIPMVFRDHAPRSRKSRLYPLYAFLMRQVAARADAVITVSESSKKDVLERLNLPDKHAGKVRVVYNGLDPVFFEEHTVPRQDPPEILYVGRMDPYKNVPQLVTAFGESMKHLPVGTRLRIIGPPDPRYPEAQNIAKNLDLLPYIDWDGHVEDACLIEAIRRASVLVLPSEYEGFGLPVAEAMASGTPVICSNASSLPEVGGEAAHYVPAGDLFALVDAFAAVMGNPGLREKMSAAGKEKAAEFRADHMARQTLAVYEDLTRS